MSSEGKYRKTWTLNIPRGFAFVVMAIFVLAAVAVGSINGALETEGNPAAGEASQNAATSSDEGWMNRVGMGSGCSRENILVFQGATAPLPNGIPTYTVEIHNVCLSGSCSISNIHMSCGWFSSARLVNPQVFRRIDYDDCLVNDGGPMNPGDAISFQYANSFKYPLSVTSVSC